MLVSIRINNCFIYDKEVELSMRADMRCRKFDCNIATIGNAHLLKSAIIMGPNNSGKTNLIRCLRSVKAIMLNQSTHLASNLFSENRICEIAISFLHEEEEYLFCFKYNASSREYIYERFAKIEYDSYHNKKEIDIIVRDAENQQYFCENDDVRVLMKAAAKNNILIYLIDTEQFEVLNNTKNIIVDFAQKIEIVDMNNIPDQKTIALLKSKDKIKDKIVNFILNADLCLDDFRYIPDEELVIKPDVSDDMKAQEEVQNLPSMLRERLHLASTYKGITVPSLFFDSTGTKKITALSSYVIESLEKGKILVVDELDNSLHFKLTRGIISLFNNDLNSRAQLICTVHDITLIDCKKLFRKEQIWFAHKDREDAYLYSLSEFTYDKDKVRADTDNMTEKYKKGVFGALPEPDLFKSLLEVRNDG